MENASLIVQMIGSVGFPIVACFAMGWYVKHTTDKASEERTEENKAHQAEMDKITEALNNNTMAITKLAERLDREEK